MQTLSMCECCVFFYIKTSCGPGWQEVLRLPTCHPPTHPLCPPPTPPSPQFLEDESGECRSWILGAGGHMEERKVGFPGSGLGPQHPPSQPPPCHQPPLHPTTPTLNSHNWKLYINTDLKKNSDKKMKRIVFLPLNVVPFQWKPVSRSSPVAPCCGLFLALALLDSAGCFRANELADEGEEEVCLLKSHFKHPPAAFPSG